MHACKRSIVVLLVACTCLIVIIVNSFNLHNFDYGSAYIILTDAKNESGTETITQTNNLENQGKTDAPHTKTYTSTEKPQNGLLLDYCNLPDLDPWDPVMAELFDPESNPHKDCKPEFKKLSNVINNSIVFDAKLDRYNCSHRCLLLKDDTRILYGEWKPLYSGDKPKCDVVQLECRDAGTRKIYKYIHALIYRNEKLLTPPDSPDMPSVHLIVLDSVSSSQFERSMVKTASYLRNNLQSQRMKYLNKVGLNSRPNGYGFMFGKSMDPIPASPISVGYHADWPEDPCFKYLDKDQFIPFRYRDAGYVTFMAEDWDYGTFNWPNCYGFKKNPTHHYMRPYHLFYQKENKDFGDILHKKQCKEDAQDLIEYYEAFLETYKDRPTFTVNWFTYLTHDDINGLYHIDDYFYKFFMRNEKHWENSYVIVMGDHGNRFHEARQTWIGEAEDNNPMLWISVPKNLRKPEVLSRLWENSNKLLSQFDVYATLVNLVHPKNPTIPNPIIYGEDLLGPLREPRTCDNLRIPMQYCLCDFNKTALPENDQTAVGIAEKCVRIINQELQNHTETKSRCAKLSIDYEEKVQAESFLTNGNQNLLRVVWSTKPGTGDFSAVALKDQNGKVTIISTTFPRSNAYGDEAKCVRNSLVQSYCYCN